jgi:hypothetical protein
MSAVYYNTDEKTSATCNVSSKVIRLILPLWLNIDKNNQVDKRKFEKRLSKIKDYRSWQKYWKELVDKNIVIFLDKNTIMVSPHECYCEGASQNTLINKWNEARNGSTVS